MRSGAKTAAVVAETWRERAWRLGNRDARDRLERGDSRYVIRPKRILPGDTPRLFAALHALAEAGLLPSNGCNTSLTEGGLRRSGPCPRCGRETACNYWDADQRRWIETEPTVCTGCRWAEFADAARSHWALSPEWIAALRARDADRPTRSSRSKDVGAAHGSSCKGPDCEARLVGGAEYCQACRLSRKMAQGS